jgi:circadian clock protein KaiC
LKPCVDKGLLHFQSSRPALYGLEMHLITMFKAITEFKADSVVVDPVSNFISVGSKEEVRSMLTRLIDFLKSRRITSLFTNLTSSSGAMEDTEVGISSLMDTWILLRDIEIGGERNRGLYVLKSRGMAHSNQIREFQLTSDGIKLLDVYVGPGGVLTGSARLAQEAQEKAQAVSRQQDIERSQRDIERQRQIMESQVTALRAQFEAVKEKLETTTFQDEIAEKIIAENRDAMARQRKADRGNGDK